MKAKDLVVGMEIYANNRKEWADQTYGGNKVIIKDTKPQHWSWSRSEQKHIGRTWSSGSSTFGILCQREDGNEEIRTLASLRGPYAETKTAVDLAVQKSKDASYQAELRQYIVRAKRDAAILNAKEIGIKAGTNYANVSVSAEQFEAMVAALAAQGWKYEV